MLVKTAPAAIHPFPRAPGLRDGDGALCAAPVLRAGEPALAPRAAGAGADGQVALAQSRSARS